MSEHDDKDSPRRDDAGEGRDGGRFRGGDRGDRGDRPDRGGDRGDRGDRGGDRGDRGGDRGDRRGGGRGGPGGGRGRRFHRGKVCGFCVDKTIYLDYKDLERLRRYVTDRGKILPRRVTGNCALHQRMLTTSLKRARHLALLPFKAR